MTTPKTTEAKPRVRREAPARGGPDRSGAKARETAKAAAPPPQPPPPMPLDIDEAVAGSVQTAYDVLAESIEQGRRSAEQFRQGEYNIRDVPGDVRSLASNVLRLTRQLSQTAFDVCEALLAQQPSATAMPEPGVTKVDPFRDPQDPPSGFEPSPAPPSTAAQPSAVPPGMMQLTVQFVGSKDAVSRNGALAQPSPPVGARDITVSPLTARSDAKPLTDVTFDIMTSGGVIATVKVPDGQPAGVYSGTVFAPNQDVPLGLLVVELPKPTATGND